MADGEPSGVEPLLLPESLQEAVEHGEVFTRRWVVETILDLVGYTPDRDLSAMRLVEPACGAGAFLGAVAARLSASCREYGRPLAAARHAVAAFDLLGHNVKLSRDVISEVLAGDGWDPEESGVVARSWVTEGDYLLMEPRESADFVVGNPPYIRLEDVPDARMSAYRATCGTMGGRADIYVGFYEVGLLSLKPGGKLGFICADRWMRNQYGKRLRDLVARRFSMDAVVTMHDVDAFDEQVLAYPAITVISNAAQGPAAAVDTTKDFGPGQAVELTAWAGNTDRQVAAGLGYQAVRLPHWFSGEDSWPSGSPDRLAMLEDLSDRFPLLEDEDTGTRVGIGVATGADHVFIAREQDAIDVEEDRLLRLAMVRDTTSGTIDWCGTHLINPWDNEGQLVSLAEYPKLKRYFEQHKETLCKRFVARKQPDRWYKTIDKVDARLSEKPKLLFPDLKLTIHPVLDEGGLYPHHNLYYIVSQDWDLRVLGGLLLSKVAEAFVSAYAVRMQGGTLRFQAQYLRKIRVPRPSDIREDVAIALADAFDQRDVGAATKAALDAYGLSDLPD